MEVRDRAAVKETAFRRDAIGQVRLLLPGK